jgi:hypothetical protein
MPKIDEIAPKRLFFVWSKTDRCGVVAETEQKAQRLASSVLTGKPNKTEAGSRLCIEIREDGLYASGETDVSASPIRHEEQ